MDKWSITAFCADERQKLALDVSAFAGSTQKFLADLGLSSVHPFCTGDGGNFSSVDVPPMGRYEVDYLQLHDYSLLESVLSHLYGFLPSVSSFFCLWFLLFSAMIAPVGCVFLLKCTPGKMSLVGLSEELPRISRTNVFWVCGMTVLSSLVIMTDSLYIHDFGPHYGFYLFILSFSLTIKACQRHKLCRLTAILFFVCIIAGKSMWDPEEHTFYFGAHPSINARIEGGLYYDQRNSFIKRIVSYWDPSTRIYSPEYGATRWMPSGDARTGLPFFLNKVSFDPEWVRVWLPTAVPDSEVIALDIAFPVRGHDFKNPVYMILHGLNGGSKEGYVRDLAMRRTRQGSTVIVMVARGMMDLPIRSWNIFHGARISDAHDSATAIRKALGAGQLLVGVGYSMGAIVLNNYVVSAGPSCALDAAFSISGALDCRYELNDTRSHLLWQPMLAGTLRSEFLLGKWGKRMRARLSNKELIRLMRAVSVVEIDRWAAVGYHGFDNVTHFYSEMSALGDIPQEKYYSNYTISSKISNLSIPLCVLHALDDPISTWRTVAANEGFMRPDRLVRSGRGNLMILLTERGGHVGWPLGWLPQRQQWEFMSEAAAHFTNAVIAAKQEAQGNKADV